MKYISQKDLKFPLRKNSKGQNGKLLIIGGSKDYPGAVALAGMAALRTGCDWVTIAAPEKVAWTINYLNPDLVTVKLKGDYITSKHKSTLTNLINKHTVLLIGNGITTKNKKIIQDLVKMNKPKVIDADAIKVISLNNIKNSILTPHQKEYELLLSNSKFKKKENDTNHQNKLNNNIIILKGPIDKIITKSKIFFNKTGNPGMTKAGTGDVLAGLVAGFLAQGLTPIQSSINATYINGLLGDIQKKDKKGYFFIASDLINDKNTINKLFKNKKLFNKK